MKCSAPWLKIDDSFSPTTVLKLMYQLKYNLSDVIKKYKILLYNIV